MAITLTPNSDGPALATVSSEEPVFVTVVSWGDNENLKGKAASRAAGNRRATFLGGLHILWAFNDKVNGRPRYRAVIKGTPVVRLRLTKVGPVFVDTQGVVVRITADLKPLPADLERQAEECGLLPVPPRYNGRLSLDPAVSRELSLVAGVHVSAFLTDKGTYVIGAATRLTEHQRLSVRLWLTTHLGCDLPDSSLQ